MKKYLSNNGEGYVDLLIKFIAIMFILTFIIKIPEPFIKYQRVTYMAKSIVRAIETTGEVNNEVTDLIADLEAATGLNPTITYSGDFTWYGGKRKVQLRKRFNVTLVVKHEITVFDMFFGPQIKFTIPITKKESGMGEVFWKSGEI